MALPDRLCRPSALLGLAAFLAAPALARDRGAGARPAASDLSAFTGARTRVVWVQDLSPGGSDPFARGDRLLLMGLDSEDGRGERPVLPNEGSFHKPMLTDDGRHVVWTDHRDRSVWTVGFDGAGLRRLRDGRAVEVWRDPSGRDWVYVMTRDTDATWFSGTHVVACPLEGRSACRPVWDETPIVMDNFQVSRDGQRIGGVFPWPRSGVLDSRSGEVRILGRGCWPALDPDRGTLHWTFDADHRRIEMTDLETDRSWWIDLAADIVPRAGQEVYHPRWSNHPRYLTLTGPYLGPGRDGIEVFDGGAGVEVWIGRFGWDFRDLEWRQVTRNRRGDFYPDVWVERGPSSGVVIDTTPVDVVPGKPAKGPLVDWAAGDREGGGARSLPGRLRGRARLSARGWLALADGAVVLRGADDLLEISRRTGGFTLELVFRSATRRQEGPARLVSFSAGPTERNFTLGQQRGDLVFRLRTEATDPNGIRYETVLGPVRPDRDQHLLVTYRPGSLAWWLDGRSHEARIPGSLDAWEAMALIAGDEWTGERDWKGAIGALRIWPRELEPREVAERLRRAGVD